MYCTSALPVVPGRISGIIDRVNNKYIASFLGMTPVSLSRLRRELRGRQDSGEPKEESALQGT